jgi:hypothetical protein
VQPFRWPLWEFGTRLEDGVCAHVGQRCVVSFIIPLSTSVWLSCIAHFSLHGRTSNESSCITNAFMLILWTLLHDGGCPWACSWMTKCGLSTVDYGVQPRNVLPMAWLTARPIYFCLCLFFLRPIRISDMTNHDWAWRLIFVSQTRYVTDVISLVGFDKARPI